MDKLTAVRCRPSFRYALGPNPVLGPFLARQTWGFVRRRDLRPQGQLKRTSTIADTKPDYIPSLSDVPTVETKPGGWAPTLVHTSGEMQFTVIRVVPGGEVPNHYHREVWDYFVPLQGQGVIEVETGSGRSEEYPMNMHSFLAMPPKVIHRVRNKSSEAPFVFLIAQSPRTKYDFIAR